MSYKTLFYIERRQIAKKITQRIEVNSRRISKRIEFKYILLCEVRKWIYESELQSDEEIKRILWGEN